MRRRLFIATFLIGLGALAGLGLSPSALAQDERRVDLPLVSVSGEDLKADSAVKLRELTFVASWCPPCEAALASTRRRQAKHHRAGYQAVVVGVPERQSPRQLERWARQFGFEGPLVFDEGGRLQGAFEAVRLPFYALVGPEGRVLYTGVEPPSDDEIERLLSR